MYNRFSDCAVGAERLVMISMGMHAYDSEKLKRYGVCPD